MLESIENSIRILEQEGNEKARRAAQELLQGLLQLNEAGMKRLQVLLKDGEEESLKSRIQKDPILGSWLSLYEKVPEEAPEKCELCAQELDERHPHLLRIEDQTILCACQACGMLFDQQHGARFRRVGGQISRLDGLLMDDSLWEELQIPIALAFFIRRSPQGKTIAVYPSALGPVVSEVPEVPWTRLIKQNPSIQDLEPDIEALLVNRLPGKQDFYRVPVDQCYRLIGIIRKNWQGFSGGEAVWKAVDDFFSSCSQRGSIHAS